MHEQILWLHSITRWVVVLSTVWVFLRFAYKWKFQKAWSEADDRLLNVYSQVFGFQILMGLALWLGVSPMAKAVVAQRWAAIDIPVLFFFFLRHPLTMISALTIFSYGEHTLQKIPDDRKAKRVVLVVGIVMLLILSAIPWPWLEIGRPLLRMPM